MLKVEVLSENCPKCGFKMFNAPPYHTRCQRCNHEWTLVPPLCQHEWVDGTDGREMRSFFRCRKCHEVFDGSKSVPQKEVE